MKVEEINGLTVAFHQGPIVASEQDAVDILGNCYGLGIDLVAIPADRLADDFFRLRSGLAGAVLQKFQNYGPLVAVVGDVSRWTAKSGSLRDFVLESNRRGQAMFVVDRTALEARL